MTESRPTTSSSGQAENHRPAKPSRRRVLRSTSVLPAAFTLLNGLAGFAAIHYAAKDGLGSPLTPAAIANLERAALFLFAAMICDMLDGRVARMTRSTSDFGAQLDSLCDMVSFGLAPAVLTLRTGVSILRSLADILPVERAVWCVAAVYVACAALRLARFNVETDQDESAHMDFRGLPSPGAAACLATWVLLFTHLMDKTSRWAWLDEGVLLTAMGAALPALTLACGLLMVSRFRYPHLVNQYIRGRRPFGYLVKLVIVLLLAVFEPFLTLAVLASAYALSGPVRAAIINLRLRRD
jgi:CDP-diacylglycerol--serine O-phosphatidyltransferase